MWIDAHSHLADPRRTDIAELLTKARAAGIGRWIQGGIDPDDWARQARLKEQFGQEIVTAFGLHPWWIATHSDHEVERGFSLLAEKLPEAQAAGELGIDLLPQYNGEKARQVDLFSRQLELAMGMSKPLVLHIVRGHSDAIKLLKRHGPFPSGGIVHSFSGGLDDAKAYVKMGLLISIGAGITKDGHEKAKKAVQTLPGSHLVLETDSEDPLLLLEIAKCAGALRKEPAELILERGSRTLKSLFR